MIFGCSYLASYFIYFFTVCLITLSSEVKRQYQTHCWQVSAVFRALNAQTEEKGTAKEKENSTGEVENLYTVIHFLLKFSMSYLSLIGRYHFWLACWSQCIQNCPRQRWDLIIFFKLTKPALVPAKKNMLYLIRRKKFSAFFLIVE